MKRIIIILILFQFCNSSLIAQSIKLSGYISPRAGANNPSHIDSLGKGGFMVVSSKLDRDSIPLDRRKFGMLVFVQNNNTLYQLKDSASAKLYSDSTDWLSIGLNSSVDVDKFLKYAKTSDSLYIKGNTLIGNTLKLDSTSSGADSLQYAKNKKIDSANSVRLVIGGGLRVDSSVYFNKDLEVKGNLILNTGLKFNDSLIVTKGARIDSSLILKGNLLLGDSLIAKGKALIGSIKLLDTTSTAADSVQYEKNRVIDSANSVRLVVGGGVRIDSSVYIKGSTLIGSTLKLDSTSSGADSVQYEKNRVIDSANSVKLVVGGGLRVDSSVYVNKDLEINGNLILNTGLKFNDSLIVTKGARIDSSLLLKGKLLLGDSLVANNNALIKGEVQLDSTLLVNRLAILNDSLNVKGRVQFDSTLTVKKNVDFRDSLFVKGNVFLDSNLEVKGNLILNTGLKFNDSLIVTKGARIDSSLILKGKLLLTDSLLAKSGLVVDRTAILNDSLNVQGRVQLDSSLIVKKNATFRDSLFVKGNVFLDSNLEVKGNLILNTGLKFNDSLIVTKGARIDSSLILKGKLYLGDSLIAKEKALIGSTLTLDSTSTTADSIVYNSNKLIDSANSVKLVVGGGIRVDSSVYIRGNFRLGGDLILDSGLFRSNFVVNLGEGVKFGRYNYKDTIQAKGKTIDQVFYEILTDITHPLYLQPRLKILYLPTIDESTTNKILRYEIGDSLGVLEFSSYFIQNNAGERKTTTYKQNGLNFSDSTVNITALTDTLYYTSSILYDTGAVLINRIGVSDSTGIILKGTIVSDTISIFPISKNYWGYSLYADTLNISDSLMLGLDSTSGKGFSDFANSASKTSFTIPITGGENYIYYAYPAFYPDLTSIMVGPFESIDAFTKIIRNVKNAQNYTQAYKIYVSINNFSDKVEKIVIN